MANDLENQRIPWFRVRLDLEAVVASLAALLVGILLGWLWEPLFWVGFTAAVAAFFAGRWSKRVAPDLATGVVAPCDGVVVSITKADVPTELRFEDNIANRIRISSSPFATNKLYAPIAGSIETVIYEAGEQSTPFAMGPTEHGLSAAFLTLESLGQEVGMRVATGGLGPRLEMTVEAGDMARLGRVVGTRRLGGWTDIYVPVSSGVLVWPGQTLIGGETVLGRLKTEADTELFDGVVEDGTFEVEDDIVEAEVSDITDDGADDFVSIDQATTPADPAQLFARLKEVTKNKDGGDPA
jgi:phosphatidylserine decarboxylase